MDDIGEVHNFNDANKIANRIVEGMYNTRAAVNVSSLEIATMATALTKAYDVLTGFCGDERFADGELESMFQAFHIPVSDFTEEPKIPNGRSIINDNAYMGDGKGGFQAIETIKAQYLIEDETVRKIIGYAIELSDQVARFKQNTFNDIGDYEAILAQEYGTKIGGKKGNKTLQTVDSLFKIQVQVSDYISFGSELQNAKALVDECLNKWASDAGPELRTIVTNAFRTDKAGQINRSQIFMLLQLDIDDPDWQEGMRAIRDSKRAFGSKTYVRCYQRETYDAPWKAVSIDLAKV